MRTSLIAGLSVILSMVPQPPRHVEAKPEEQSEPPSISLSSESTPAGLPGITIGISYHDQEVESARIVEEKAAADRRSAQRASLQVKIRKTTEQPVPIDNGIRDRAMEMVSSLWDSSEWDAFDFIISRESGWNLNAVNPSSGACGLAQANPCSKMADRSPEGQIRWAISYISSRYGTPSAAKSFWVAHRWF